MGKKYLLVCEGPTDIVIFNQIATHLGGTIVEISPTKDATSNTYPPQGWGEVRNWCMRQGKSNMKGNPLEFYRRFHNADGIIIHIDTDIAHHLKINGKTGVPGDKNWCGQAIDLWLGSHKGLASTHYILTTHSTETWILATYSNTKLGLAAKSLQDYETILTPQVSLQRLGYAVDGNGELKKSGKRYRTSKYAPRIVCHLSKAKHRSAELRKFVDLF